MVEKVTPFTWLDSITQKKGGDLMEEHGEAAYPAFMVNRGLSYYVDCILYAAEINTYQYLDPKLQYDYFMESIRPKKRFAKWGKKKKSEDVDFIREVYGFSRDKAEAALKIITEEQLQALKEERSRGHEQ